MEEKKIRWDKKKNVAKVVKEVLHNEVWTQREIAENTWLWLGTVNRVIKELKKDKQFQESLHKLEKSRYLINDKFKELISNELIQEFINYCWNIYNAKDNLEKLILLHLWKTKTRKKVTEYTRYSLLERAWFKCQACWEKPNKDNDIVLHIDHIIPVNLGWLDVIENMQVLCNKCNLSKWDRFIYNHNKDE